MKTSITLELDEAVFAQLERNVSRMFKNETSVEEWMAHSIEYMALLLHKAEGEDCRNVASPLYGKKIPFAGKNYTEKMV